MSPKKYLIFSRWLIIIDMLTIAAGFSAAYWVRFLSGFLPTPKGVPDFVQYFRVIIIIIPIFLLIFRSYRLYELGRYVRRVYELLTVVKAITLAFILTMALTFIYREFSYSRAVLLFAWMFSILFTCLGRYAIIQLQYFFRSKEADFNILILGTTNSAKDLIHWTKENKHYGQNITGILKTASHPEAERTFEGVSVLGTILDFNRILEEHQFDQVILADTSIPREVTTELMLKCEDKLIGFKLVADYYGLMTHHVDVEYVSNVPLLGLKRLPLDDVWNRGTKRLFDIVSSFFALVLLFPILVLIALFVKMSSSGPVLYSQERIGRDGKQFNIYKFRTMIADAENTSGPVWAKKDDHRVTSIGKILRKLNLDELPQLWNVFIGEMSLVGPRPERPHFVEQFRGHIPRYMSRHKIKSGLTGWAQVHGLRGNTSLEERIKYDLYYMENWTLMMDVEILFATVFAYKNAY